MQIEKIRHSGGACFVTPWSLVEETGDEKIYDDSVSLCLWFWTGGMSGGYDVRRPRRWK